MPATQLGRSRNPDDSRSDASSVATKDRRSTMSTSVISKIKKGNATHFYTVENGASILSLHRNSQNAASPALVEPADPDLPRVSLLPGTFHIHDTETYPRFSYTC